MHEIFEEYIPDFTYCLVDNHKFSNKELLERKDEMSLIMLLNKIQTKADLSEFLHIPSEEINRIASIMYQAEFIQTGYRGMCKESEDAKYGISMGKYGKDRRTGNL